MSETSAGETGGREAYEQTLRDELVKAGIGAADEWLSLRANRRMSDVNRRRLAGHVVNALWEPIIHAVLGITSMTIAETEAERDQLRSDWMRQAAQLNRIGAAVGHALILRATDDADAEEVRVAMERACEDVQDILAEAHQAAEQRTERYRVLCANLINGGLARERDAATLRADTAERALAEMRATDEENIGGDSHRLAKRELREIGLTVINPAKYGFGNWGADTIAKLYWALMRQRGEAIVARRELAEMRERIGEGYTELNDRAHDGLFFAPDDLSYDAGYSEGLRTAYGAAAAIVRNWKPADGG